MRAKTIIGLTLASVLCLGARGEAFIGSSKTVFYRAGETATSPSDFNSDESAKGGRLARVTAYWPGEDYYTNHKMTATGVRLRPGYCAVDSNIIPYGSLVRIPGVGNYLAMDTGTAVISRKAARESGHNRDERGALVIDLYFPSRKAGELFSREGPKFAMVEWERSGGVLASN